MARCDSIRSYDEILRQLRSTFASGVTRPSEWRQRQLSALRAIVVDRSRDIAAALASDLHKSQFEAETSECGLVRREIDHTLSHLDEWIAPRGIRIPLLGQPGRGHIVREPLGMVLIIGAWNYPLNLIFAPLVGALAGGNVVVLKPSEVAPVTSRLISRLVPEYLDREAVIVVEGGHDVVNSLLETRFDHIFFTGSTDVARAILSRVAPHLTPVTLELGYKSPCLVDCETDLSVAARRIVWGKFLNAGQTCVAPDYVLAHREIEAELILQMGKAIRAFYGMDPRRSPDYGRIINDRHFQRLTRLLESGEIACGGETDASERYIAPTILRGVTIETPVMQEEIFGPILPVLSVADMDEAIHFVSELPPPLVLYLFSTNRAVQEAVVERTTTGSVCVNDVVLQMAIQDFPFGGVGASGMGHYHGRWSFETFTRPRGVFTRSQRFELPLRYPPHSDAKSRWIARLT